LDNLGLIIIDEENDFSYKQDQVPHYQVREVAAMRVAIEKAKLILGSSAPSLESFYLSQKAKMQYLLVNRTKIFPEIKIVDTAYQRVRLDARQALSRYTIDAISAVLNAQGKILLFLNRKGFATSAHCHNCGVALKCPRCNINLVYYFKDNILSCSYCNFKMQPPNICPQCNSGYIKYAGLGTEKIESELARVFPAAKIKRWESQDVAGLKDADILISTQHIIRQANLNFDLIAVLSIDNSLHRADFRAAEKTFALLTGLAGLTDKSLIIQTRLPKHHCFRALIEKDPQIFYDEELRQRRQLKFPPFRHLGLVKLRGRDETKVKQASDTIFKKLCLDNKDKEVKVVSVNPAHPLKLRGNFYWQILLQSREPRKISKFLKNSLKNFSHSGIIVTVDIDPI
jgi:primosomal protein N' (replication factor Y)